MGATLSSVGRVCLCEWDGPVSATTVISLLSNLRRIHEQQAQLLALIVIASATSATRLARRSNAFLDALPAIWSYCERIAVACDKEHLVPLRQVLEHNEFLPLATPARTLAFFELVDDALLHTIDAFPHEVLELRRQRLRSGTWLIEGEPAGFRVAVK